MLRKDHAYFLRNFYLTVLIISLIENISDFSQLVTLLSYFFNTLINKILQSKDFELDRNFDILLLFIRAPISRGLRSTLLFSSSVILLLENCIASMNFLTIYPLPDLI